MRQTFKKLRQGLRDAQLIGIAPEVRGEAWLKIGLDNRMSQGYRSAEYREIRNRYEDI